MKKLFCYLFVVLCISSCNEETPSTQNDLSKEEITFKSSDVLKTDFGYAIAKGLAESLPFRSLLKEEALKMFNNDYDVLYHLIKNKELTSGYTVRDLLRQYFSSEDELMEIEKALPLLTIFIPELPENSFSGELWDVNIQIPVVGIAYSETSDVAIINSLGEKYMLSGEYIPGFPVIVIKENERVVLRDGKNVAGRKGGRVLRSDDNMAFEFLSDSFDGSIKFNNSARTTPDIDQKMKSAYEIYQNADGWQRDYIYYDITPSQTSGEFVYDFAEYIRTFTFIGDPAEVYTKIADQTGDPKYKLSNSRSGGFTEGFYEFKVQLLYNSKNGLGEARSIYFPASPYSLFTIEYDKMGWGDFIKYAPRVTGFKTIHPEVFLLNWDLESYASTIKIEIEEVDVSETYTNTESRSVEFATNFGIEGSVLKKIGLKFGASLKQSGQQSTTKTYTLNSDPLGNVIVNFADKFIIGTGTNASGYTTYTTREYAPSELGYFSISVEPKRVQ